MSLPLEAKASEDVSNIEKMIIEKNNEIYKYYLDQLEDLKYKIKPNVFDIQEINNYITEKYQYNVRPF